MSFFARLFRLAPPPSGPIAAGERALRRREYDVADAHFALALAAAASDRERAAAHNKRALVAIARGDRAAAGALVEAALMVYAAYVPAIVNAGNLLLEADDVAAAIERFETAIRLDPDYPDAHHNLGVAYKRAGRRSDAVRELRRATGLERRQRNTAP